MWHLDYVVNTSALELSWETTYGHVFDCFCEAQIIKLVVVLHTSF